MDVQRKRARQQGPTSIVMVGVHGNERSGVEVLPDIVKKVHIVRGTVYFVLGNPKAVEQNVRFVDTNLNRMFMRSSAYTPKERKSYEYKRAKVLKKYLREATALLDVHASNSPKSTPFLICEPNAQAIIRSLPVSLVVHGFDKHQPGGTDYYMNTQGRIGICVETGYTKDKKSHTVARDSIYAFLSKRGHIDAKARERKQAILKVQNMYVTKVSFVPRKQYKDFASVKKGEVIGYDGVRPVKAKKGGRVLFVRERKGPREEAFLFLHGS